MQRAGAVLQHQRWRGIERAVLGYDLRVSEGPKPGMRERQFDETSTYISMRLAGKGSGNLSLALEEIALVAADALHALLDNDLTLK